MNPACLAIVPKQLHLPLGFEAPKSAATPFGASPGTRLAQKLLGAPALLDTTKTLPLLGGIKTLRAGSTWA